MRDTGLDGLCYDLIDCMYAWCECTDQTDCKSVISEIGANGVSIGDFTKAILKISTIGREIMGICECVELAHKFSQIDALILKYVATNQSLYL